MPFHPFWVDFPSCVRVESEAPQALCGVGHDPRGPWGTQGRAGGPLVRASGSFTTERPIARVGRGRGCLVGPQVARRELEKYQPELEMATESGWLVKPYWDLFQRAIMIILGARS